MDIREDDLTGAPTIALITHHFTDQHANSPPGTAFALDIDALRGPDITVWTAWDGATILGVGALKELDRHHGEIKSMHTLAAYRGKGVARALLDRIIENARARGYRRLSLETGSYEDFAPARRLYERCGFTYCGPFADYQPLPTSAFMTLELTA